MKNPLNAVQMVPVQTLKPHPSNRKLYGAKQRIDDLTTSLRECGRIEEPLKATKQQIVVAGCRRLLAAKEVGIKKVPVMYADDLKDEEEEIRAILFSNLQRAKTNEQRVREGIAWFDVLREGAEVRSKQGKKLSDPVADLPPGDLDARGKTRDKIAVLTGIGSGRNFDLGKKAVFLIDDLVAQKKLLAAEGVRRELNRSFAAGMKLVKRYKAAPQETLEVAELIGSEKAKHYGDAFGKMLRNRGKRIPKTLPQATERYQLEWGDIIQVGDRISDALRAAKNLCIITDIPYVSKPYGDGNGGNWEHAAKKIAEFAVEYLPEKGSLLVMCGQYHLPGVMDILCSLPELSWYWQYVVDMPGASRRQPKRNVNTQYKCILHLVKGSASDGEGSLIQSRIMSDVIRSEPLDPNERLHEWQQPKIAFQVLIEALTNPGDVVCDPMMGSGTTGVVAVEKKRKFIGIEIDEETFRIAQKRLLETAEVLDVTEKRARRKKRKKRP